MLPGTFEKDNAITDRSAESIMAQHDFTFTFGGNASENAKHNLGGLTLHMPSANSTPLPDSIWGWNVGDEPGTAQFPAFAAKFAAIKQWAPTKMGFANLLESYCPPLSLCVQSTS